MTAIAGPVSVEASRSMMGGAVSVQILDASDEVLLERAARRVLDRIEAWAGRLTRFSPDSELMRLNAATTSLVPIGPTLTAALDWARMAEGMTDGFVDASLLDERLAAEAGLDPSIPVRPVAAGPSAGRRAAPPWSASPGSGSTSTASRRAGWRTARSRSPPAAPALVDGDGDVAIRVAPGRLLGRSGSATPASRARCSVSLDLGADGDEPRGWGIADLRHQRPSLDPRGRRRPPPDRSRARGDPPRRT